jgi:hypothetical protein
MMSAANRDDERARETTSRYVEDPPAISCDQRLRSVTEFSTTVKGGSLRSPPAQGPEKP